MDKTDWQKKGAGHRERLRSRFMEKGIVGFTDAEILEILLTFGTPRSDCKEAAKALLKEFGSFSAVIDAPTSALERVRGVGSKNSFALRFLHAAASHYLRDRLQGKEYIRSSAEVVRYLSHSMRGLKREVFKVVFLDSSHGIIDVETLSEGTVNINTVYPREVISRALALHAAALIIAHNHPSGSLQPSAQDKALTKTLYFLCSSLQLELLDHIIIGDGSFSFADCGLMTEIRTDSEKVTKQFK